MAAKNRIWTPFDCPEQSCSAVTLTKIKENQPRGKQKHTAAMLARLGLVYIPSTSAYKLTIVVNILLRKACETAMMCAFLGSIGLCSR